MEDILASIRRIIADDQSRSLAAASNAYRRVATQNVTPPPASLAPIRSTGDVPIEPTAGERVAAPPAALASTDAEHLLPSRGAVAAPQAEPVAASEPAQPIPDALQAGLLPLPHLNPPPIPPTIEEDLSVIAEIVHAGAASILNTPPLPAGEAAQTEDDALLSGPETRPPVLVEPLPKRTFLPSQPVVPAGSALEALQVPASPTDLDAPLGVLSLHGFEAEPEPDAWDEAAPEAPPEPLVSSSVGSTIESSFQALATSVFLQNTAAVEATTREMLRPLLKTWLDDNLPTIVERLVRIEIERVARGSRH